MRAIKKVISNIVDWFLYTLLSDEQKERLSNFFSEGQKDLIRKVTQHGKRRKQKMYVKQIKDNVYSLGLRKKGLQQFQTILQESKDLYLKRLVAWELVLYYANLETAEDAQIALKYINDAKNGEKDPSQLRRIAIVEAECLQKTGEDEKAKRLIGEQLENDKHQDLYLALANLEDDIEGRFKIVNKVYAMHDLRPITFREKVNPEYDDLTMAKRSTPVNSDVKISVILPAYNGGEGLRVAVESILTQTWTNLELIIVDDHSTDDTLSIAQSYAAKDKRVIVRQTEQNSGPYVARNIALKLATGDFVTINDADDWSHEQKLEIQANHLLENSQVIANTSAHARLTESLTFYRRGMPGRYIFPNMSSIMFRREPVMEKLGYWDSVRFAADGEFKRRLIREFGKQSFIDLQSGPLSLPRQAVSSLTSSSAFGYNGFFMGARKEFVASFTHYYETASGLSYPFPMEERPYPVPEPMWPIREQKVNGMREFDLVIATDFREEAEGSSHLFTLIKEIIAENKGKRIGLVALYEYNLKYSFDFAKEIRDILLRGDAQVLVYGEKINTEKLFIIDYNMLLDEQIYIPDLLAKEIEMLVRHCENVGQLISVSELVEKKYNQGLIITPLKGNVRKQIREQLSDEKSLQLAREDWM